MRTPLLVLAAALICLGLATSCERTTGGTVAMTTEPAPSTTSHTTTTSSRPTAFPPTRTPPTSEVPAPGNALTMTCKEYVGLDDATRRAVVRAILEEEEKAEDEESPFGLLGEEFAASLATTLCDFVPDSTVREVLTGSAPR